MAGVGTLRLPRNHKESDGFDDSQGRSACFPVSSHRTSVKQSSTKMCLILPTICGSSGEIA